ncbi:MAG: lysophospholipid acyltransferase family protein [Candidatus Thermoplasmatota archaeon]
MPSRSAKKAAGKARATKAAKTAPAKKAVRKQAKKLVAKRAATKDTLDPEFVGKFLPYLRALRGYTRLKVDGLENIPKKGSAILAANHTGWLGLDYALAALVVHDEVGRTPRGMVHEAWFLTPATAQFAAKMGLSKVSKESMAEQLGGNHLVMVFPEGEHGAFRPVSNYEVLEFARGFVRVAMQKGVPVIPVAILGGEESNPVDKTIKSYEQLLKLPLIIPTNLLPKPVKWRIRFLPPLDFEGFDASDADDAVRVHAIARDVQQRVQTAIRTLQKERGNPYI